MSPAASKSIHMTDISSGFAPIASTDATVLILGSLPSQQSLRKREYYGNPQNAFWQVMGELFDAGPEIPYVKRTEKLRCHGIAVWDVLQSSVRSGSMDAAIDLTTAIPNDFQAFFEEHPMLALLCFNGKKAAELYRRLVAPQGISAFDNIEYRIMPSTSPAYASMNLDEKVRHWSAVRRPGGSNRSA